MKFSDKLQQAIDASGFKKKEVAERAGITQVALSKYINGVVEPKAENLTKIAKALNLPPSFFYDEGGENDLNSVYKELQEWKERALTAEGKLQAMKRVLPLISEANAILSKNF